MTGWAAILDAAAAEYQHFRHACAQPRATQLARLRRILGANRDSAFGRAHGFANIDDLDAFRAAVAIRGYDEVRPWVERAAAGEPAVLTADPVVAFEETGGSTSGRKLIPYNAPALRAFRTAVLAWLADLARARPGAVAGRAYAAVSPALPPRGPISAPIWSRRSRRSRPFRPTSAPSPIPTRGGSRPCSTCLRRRISASCRCGARPS
jgi:hypothetical protein